MFEDDPGLYRRLVAADFDSKVDGQRTDVAKARKQLDRELKELDAMVAYSKRFRPKDVPMPAPPEEGDAV